MLLPRGGGSGGGVLGFGLGGVHAIPGGGDELGEFVLVIEVGDVLKLPAADGAVEFFGVGVHGEDVLDRRGVDECEGGDEPEFIAFLEEVRSDDRDRAGDAWAELELADALGAVAHGLLAQGFVVGEEVGVGLGLFFHGFLFLKKFGEFAAGLVVGVLREVEDLAVAPDFERAGGGFVEVDSGLSVGEGGADVVDRVLGIGLLDLGGATGHPMDDLAGAGAVRPVLFKPIGGGLLAVLAVDSHAGRGFFEFESEGHQGGSGLDVLGVGVGCFFHAIVS